MDINSFAEFYMQIAEKYTKEYIKALELLRNERKRYLSELKKIKGIRVIPSQANYVMIELTNGQKAKEITKSLLVKSRIFVKDLTEKMNGEQYLRLAIRKTEDNDKLISALMKIINE